MPRVVGQIDRSKSEAILDAAAEVLSERGLSAPIEEIARRAQVSKQTVYNHFGDKLSLLRAMVARRAGEITAAFDMPGAVERVEETLAAYAFALLSAMHKEGYGALSRAVVAAIPDLPEAGRAMYEAGPLASRRRLAAFLEAEDRAGRLQVDDPIRAAELFGGMVVGMRYFPALLGLLEPESDAALRRHAHACAARFMRAYAPA